MAEADVSFLVLIAPILVFLLVTLVVAAMLAKTKFLGENKWLQVFIALIIASLFVSTVGSREFVLTIIPWTAVLLVSLFLFLLVMGIVGQTESMEKGIGLIAILVLGIIILFSAYVVFSDLFVTYLPGPGFGENADPQTLYFFEWLYSPRVYGAILLIAASAVASWILVKSN